jgi:transcriptional regulator with XRE-family HTH domain
MVGANMRRLREARGLSATELARGVGAHITHISRCEAGVYLPGSAFVIKAAEFLKVSTDEILLPPEKPRQTVTIGQRLDRILDQLTNEERTGLEALLSACTEQIERRSRG